MFQKVIPFIIVVIFVLSSHLYSQENESENVPGTAFYLELGGKPFFSVNVDFRMNKSNRVSFGIQPVYGIIPNLMYYHLEGEKYSKFELGGGVSYIPVKSEDLEGDWPVLIHGVLGYRYQKKNGLLFRIGFTPVVVVSEVFLPMVGISFGYSL
ncbi:MAG: hypothetical protein KAU01_09540 [Candidatus Cloacimonetes bacterium]|nr:hypothetical protein [Candidatus Cloacimonadota bacterium]